MHVFGGEVPVTVKVLIPLSLAIVRHGKWRKVCTVKGTEGISYHEVRMRVKQTQGALASNVSYAATVRIQLSCAL